MIELWPHPYNQFTCPRCHAKQVTLNKVIFQGIHLLADLECPQCQFGFYQDYPTGHGITYPAVIDKKHLTLLSPAGLEWLTQPLLDSLRNPIHTALNIYKQNVNPIQPTDTVIFLNCLDAWYGHVLLKLLNLQFYHDLHPTFKKIVLVPKGFNWMIPDYADEVWTVDLSLRNTKNYYTYLDSFIKTALNSYAVVYHASGYSHPQLQEIRVEDFFKTRPFNMDQFATLHPRITVIYREDRLWISPFFNKAFNILNYRKIKFLNKLFLGQQIRRINRFAAALKKILPKTEIFVCGLGKSGTFGADIEDKRSVNINEAQELEWCDIYSKSHIIIGIHGSNMLIPSSLAASWIEILPDDRIGNITQDLFCRHSYVNMAYFGRFASEHDTLERIVLNAQKMITDYSAFKTHQFQSYQIST